MKLEFKFIPSNTVALEALQELEETTNQQIINNFKIMNQIDEL